ncbi:CLUMA_CG015469, isoform A [Clunio marinus]|uniref:CLUMA_CG015469, isoform A n=1 Tax=Clunio marinus TaxID=568069 RepID=A0A1J1ISB1_9DIPT|nr:CLUMA_CG015469, isoform A [Clunio marinus]
MKWPEDLLLKSSIKKLIQADWTIYRVKTEFFIVEKLPYGLKSFKIFFYLFCNVDENELNDHLILRYQIHLSKYQLPCHQKSFDSMSYLVENTHKLLEGNIWQQLSRHFQVTMQDDVVRSEKILINLLKTFWNSSFLSLYALQFLTLCMTFHTSHI